MKFDLDCWILTWSLDDWDWCFIPRIFSWIDLYSLNIEEALNRSNLVSPKGLTDSFPRCLYMHWRWYFHFTTFICIFYAFIHNLVLRFCMIGIRGDSEGEGAWWQKATQEAFQSFSYDQGDMRIDVLHTKILNIHNSSDSMNHFYVFMINPYGTWWRGFSCPKIERCSIQYLEVACGSRHSFASNHERMVL